MQRKTERERLLKQLRHQNRPAAARHAGRPPTPAAEREAGDTHTHTRGSARYRPRRPSGSPGGRAASLGPGRGGTRRLRRNGRTQRRQRRQGPEGAGNTLPPRAPPSTGGAPPAYLLPLEPPGPRGGGRRRFPLPANCFPGHSRRRRRRRRRSREPGAGPTWSRRGRRPPGDGAYKRGEPGPVALSAAGPADRASRHFHWVWRFIFFYYFTTVASHLYGGSPHPPRPQHRFLATGGRAVSWPRPLRRCHGGERRPLAAVGPAGNEKKWRKTSAFRHKKPATALALTHAPPPPGFSGQTPPCFTPRPPPTAEPSPWRSGPRSGAGSAPAVRGRGPASRRPWPLRERD